MRKVAIIKTEERYFNHGDDWDTIVKQITDWTEISDEDFVILNRAAYQHNFIVIEQPIDQHGFIIDTVASYIEQQRQKEIKEAEDKKKRAKAAMEKKLKKDLKDKESKLELYKKLQQELGIQEAASGK
jgi:hypothetical protein